VVDGPYTIADLGRDVLELLDSEPVRAGRVHYAGLSLGGMVGMWLASHAPERIDRLALVCTSPYLPPASGWMDRAEAVKGGGMGAVADVVVGRWFTPAFAEHSPGVVADARAMLMSIPVVGYAGCCAAIAALDQRADLPKIAAPTLVISAEHDTSIPPEHGRTIVASVPGARFELVPGAHIANLECPSVVTRLLIEHLTDPAG
jgi:3-oxoadipate enol-lactonase